MCKDMKQKFSPNTVYLLKFQILRVEMQIIFTAQKLDSLMFSAFIAYRSAENQCKLK